MRSELGAKLIVRTPGVCGESRGSSLREAGLRGGEGETRKEEGKIQGRSYQVGHTFTRKQENSAGLGHVGHCQGASCHLSFIVCTLIIFITQCLELLGTLEPLWAGHAQHFPPLQEPKAKSYLYGKLG